MEHTTNDVNDIMSKPQEIKTVGVYNRKIKHQDPRAKILKHSHKRKVLWHIVLVLGACVKSCNIS